MNIKIKTTTPSTTTVIARPFLPSRFILTASALICFALSPPAWAVVPPPDGGYPGANTAEGNGALNSLSPNARGAGIHNTALGFHTLYDLTTGAGNTAVGSDALLDNVDGSFNTATGTQALFYNIGASDGNTADGYQALYNNYYGLQNTAVGYQACHSGGFNNTAVGFQALHANIFGGEENTAVGNQALYNNTFTFVDQGSYNTATGSGTLFTNTTGSYNTATGFGALYLNDTGARNTASGRRALYSNLTGDLNTAVGVDALLNNTSGSSNIALGDGAGFNVTSADDVICIGSGGENIGGTCYIGNIFGRISSGGVPVLINAGDRLGTLTSSKRFKEQIKPMGQESEALFALKPVSFRYKKEIDPAGKSQLGLVAEDVERVNSDLVVRDKDGKPYSVRYDQVNAMLLNEFLKEHKKVEELKSTGAKQEAALAEQRKDFEAAIAQQRQEIQILTAQLKQQAAQIQRVTAEIEIKKFATGRIRRGGPAARVAASNP
jgi:hypothetical protein